VVPDYELTGTYSQFGRPSSSQWISTTKSDYVPKKVSRGAGRHDASSKDPRNQNDGKGTDRFEQWSTTFKDTHRVGYNGYMFLGVPSRFKQRHVPPGEPLDTTTTNRQCYTGQPTKPPTSLRQYWERLDEYLSEDLKFIGKDSKHKPFCREPDRQTTSHAMHEPLHEQYPQVFGPKTTIRTDHVLSGRPVQGMNTPLGDTTSFRETYGRGGSAPSKAPHYPAGLISTRVVGKKQLEQCLPRADVVKTRMVGQTPKFQHKTIHQTEYVPKTVRHTEWYGSVPEDPERQGVTRFYPTREQRPARMDTGRI